MKGFAIVLLGVLLIGGCAAEDPAEFSTAVDFCHLDCFGGASCVNGVLEFYGAGPRSCPATSCVTSTIACRSGQCGRSACGETEQYLSGLIHTQASWVDGTLRYWTLPWSKDLRITLVDGAKKINLSVIPRSDTTADHFLPDPTSLTDQLSLSSHIPPHLELFVDGKLIETKGASVSLVVDSDIFSSSLSWTSFCSGALAINTGAKELLLLVWIAESIGNCVAAGNGRVKLALRFVTPQDLGLTNSP